MVDMKVIFRSSSRTGLSSSRTGICLSVKVFIRWVQIQLDISLSVYYLYRQEIYISNLCLYSSFVLPIPIMYGI